MMLYANKLLENALEEITGLRNAITRERAEHDRLVANLRAEVERLRANVLHLEQQHALAKCGFEASQNTVAELRCENARLREAVDAVFTLIADSHGVAGLHLNGDVAPWDELLRGGHYEDWLAPLSDVAEKRL